MKCSICDKELFGHPTPTKGPVICGSCTLTKTSASDSGKSVFSVRLGMNQNYTKQIPDYGDTVLYIKVKSNNIRNRVFLLDNVPLTFNDKGEAQFPAHRKELLDREMLVRPHLFSIVEDPTKTNVEPEVVPAPVLDAEPAPVKSEKKPRKAALKKLAED